MALTIDGRQREALRDLMGCRFFLGGDLRLRRAREQGVGHGQLARESGEDMRLMEDLGWLDREQMEALGMAGAGQAGAELRMPAPALAAALRRAREDAIADEPNRIPNETEEERRERLQFASQTCEGLLARLEDREENQP